MSRPAIGIELLYPHAGQIRPFGQTIVSSSRRHCCSSPNTAIISSTVRIPDSPAHSASDIENPCIHWQPKESHNGLDSRRLSCLSFIKEGRTKQEYARLTVQAARPRSERLSGRRVDSRTAVRSHMPQGIKFSRILSVISKVNRSNNLRGRPALPALSSHRSLHSGRSSLSLF